MLANWRHNFARRGDLVVALLIGCLLTALLVALGINQVSRDPLNDYEVVGSKPDYLHVLMSASRTPLASSAITSRAGMAQYGGDFVELEELPPALRRLCIDEFEQVQPDNYEDKTSGISLRSGWPLRSELLGGRARGWPRGLEPGWLGATLIHDGQPIGMMPYRPAILPLLANLLLFALPIVTLLGLFRTQIALVRAARGTCATCGYPRPKTTCPECGQEH